MSTNFLKGCSFRTYVSDDSRMISVLEVRNSLLCSLAHSRDVLSLPASAAIISMRSVHCSQGLATMFTGLLQGCSFLNCVVKDNQDDA
jgi:hypothetical protein